MSEKIGLHERFFVWWSLTAVALFLSTQTKTKTQQCVQCDDDGIWELKFVCFTLFFWKLDLKGRERHDTKL